MDAFFVCGTKSDASTLWLDDASSDEPTYIEKFFRHYWYAVEGLYLVHFISVVYKPAYYFDVKEKYYIITDKYG